MVRVGKNFIIELNKPLNLPKDMSEEKAPTALVMTTNQEENIMFGFYEANYLRDEKVYRNTTFYDEFQEGSK